MTITTVIAITTIVIGPTCWKPQTVLSASNGSSRIISEDEDEDRGSDDDQTRRMGESTAKRSSEDVWYRPKHVS